MTKSVAGHFDNGRQLKEVTARELSAVCGGDNNMLMNWSTNTGVVFEVGGRPSPSGSMARRRTYRARPRPRTPTGKAVPLKHSVGSHFADNAAL